MERAKKKLWYSIFFVAKAYVVVIGEGKHGWKMGQSRRDRDFRRKVKWSRVATPRSTLKIFFFSYKNENKAKSLCLDSLDAAKPNQSRFRFKIKVLFHFDFLRCCCASKTIGNRTIQLCMKQKYFFVWWNGILNANPSSLNRSKSVWSEDSKNFMAVDCKSYEVEKDKEDV